MLDNELKDALTAILRTELSPVLVRLDGIGSRLDGVDAQFNGVDARLNSIDGKLEAIDTRLERLEFEQSQIKQAVLETNEIVKRLENVQEQQHRIIELLSARSIEQEAKLKKII
ncbi:hypothetical protein [Paenibacillus qinlingensis]|uniref:Archaellum component FlaC n=1 Tax=Paenibacillus qinlingensis TaxID=1837343 RepID=A0ABU1P230_9BACL|nr:hypothetical protein [Paenibacillus qinlingensis]MDR6553619.1 archaellum component FlaC [Paenibacillus qinlingensis]